MPFAATVLSDHANKYFQFPQNKNFYKYMTNCVRTNNFGSLKLEAALHPHDKTCRPQILNKEDNKEYYDLIKEFQQSFRCIWFIKYFLQYSWHANC